LIPDPTPRHEPLSDIAAAALDPTGATVVRPFGSRWLRAMVLGLPGIAVLGVQFSVPQSALPPGLRDAAPVVVALLTVLNPLLLLGVAAAVGAAVAPATGLCSVAASAWRRQPGEPAAWARLAPHLPAAIAWGLAVAVLLHLADRAFTPLLGEQWAAVQARAEGPVSLGGLAAGVLYGGFTEEVMMRWGVMGLVVWLGLRLSRQRDRAAAQGGPPPAPGAAVAWVGILVAALLFGAAHLPAVAVLSEVTPLLVVRTVGLNMIGGIVYGWLFWRRNLESAIAAHAATHVGFAIVRWLPG
jgi:hypothetical protein